MNPFDIDYSSEVPLSRILDVLVDDNEKPETIVAFLDLHIDDIEDILANSSSAPKIFQLDFALRCYDRDIKRLLRMAKDAKGGWLRRYGSFLSWQILSAQSQRADSVKFSCRAILKAIVASGSTSHPYHYGCGVIVEPFDRQISSYCTHDDVANQVSRWSVDALKSYYSNAEWSIFKHRMCQYDVIESLSEDKKFVALMSIADGASYAENLCIQLLDSDDHIDVKLRALEIMSGFSYDYEFIEGSNMRMILDCKTFSQMMMKATLLGEFDMRLVAIELLRRKRFDVLHDWAEHDKDNLNSCLNVSDVVEHEFKKYENMKKVAA